jgi:hypothetical protein
MTMKMKMLVKMVVPMMTSMSDSCFASIAYLSPFFGVSMPKGEKCVEFY